LHSPIRDVTYEYAYFADTFIFDPSTFSWKHILTRGFPTYRALSQLITDPKTGKVLLFGGYTDNNFVPSRNRVTRAFNDIWHLRIDMQGGVLRGGGFRGGFEDGEGGAVAEVF